MTFPYGDGVGTLSIPAIEALAAKSGISLTMTNGDPVGSGGYHGTGNACDFSNGGDAGTPEMDRFAAFWMQYAPYLLELIHTNQGGPPYSGTYVKLGQVVDGAAFYGLSLELQHRNHVHVAATNHGIMSAIAAGGSAINTVTPASPGDIQTVGLTSSIPGVSQATALFNFVIDPHNWIRLAEFLAGAFLLFLGIKALGAA